MRILLLMGGLLCASTMALADTHEQFVAQEPAVETVTEYSCHHEYIMVRDRCGCWRAQYVPRPTMRSPSTNYGTTYPFRHRPTIDTSRFPRFQSWTPM